VKPIMPRPPIAASRRALPQKMQEREAEGAQNIGSEQTGGGRSSDVPFRIRRAFWRSSSISFLELRWPARGVQHQLFSPIRQRRAAACPTQNLALGFLPPAAALHKTCARCSSLRRTSPLAVMICMSFKNRGVAEKPSLLAAARRGLSRTVDGPRSQSTLQDLQLGGCGLL